MLKSFDLKWDKMSQEVLEYCKSCEQCSRLRKGRKEKILSILPRTGTRAFQSCAIDILQAVQGYKAVLILGLVDHLMKFLLLEQVTC